MTEKTDDTNPKSSDPNYIELVAAFGADRILERREYLYVVADDLVKRQRFESKDFFISPTLINEVVINYFSDFKRLKDFHVLERGNRIKIASYMGFWISREKPIQLTQTDYEEPTARKINNLFTLTVILDVLYSNEIIFAEADELRGYTNFVELLLYTLRFRITTPQSLELALQSLVVEKVPYAKK